MVKPYFETENGKLYHGDCLEIMKGIPDKSIDMILCDLPYNTIDSNWDKLLPFDELKSEYLRILKSNGVISLTAQQPFTSLVVTNFIDQFKHFWVWEKDKCGNFLNTKGEPLKYTEDVLIFSPCGFAYNANNKATYNPQMREGTGKPRRTNSERFGLSIKEINKRPKYMPLISDPKTDGLKRYPINIIYFPVPYGKDRIHPTQKPVKLFRYLVLTYTNKGDTVLDNCIGSGTTAVAAETARRKWVGIEKDLNYCQKAAKRIRAETRQLTIT